MNDSKLIAGLRMLTMVGCLLHVGCMAETAEGDRSDQEVGREPNGSDERAALGTAPSDLAATFVWGIHGLETCLDFCGSTSCSCISPICPGATPVRGQPCTYSNPDSGNICFSRPSRGTTIHFFCGNLQ